MSMIGCQKTTAPGVEESSVATSAPTIETIAPTEPTVSTNEYPVKITELFAVYIVNNPIDSTHGKYITFKFENLSSYELTFSTSLYVLNGKYEMTQASTTIVGAEHIEFKDITFFVTDLNQAGIETISSVEFALDITYETDDGLQWPHADTHIINFVL
jgi:hypothetical protein